MIFSLGVIIFSLGVMIFSLEVIVFSLGVMICSLGFSSIDIGTDADVNIGVCRTGLGDFLDWGGLGELKTSTWREGLAAPILESTSMESSRRNCCCCSIIESVSISISSVDIACSVSQRESRVDGSCARLGTGLAPGLHSGVTIVGDDKTNSAGPDLCGLGVLVALCDVMCDKLICNGWLTGLFQDSED